MRYMLMMHAPRGNGDWAVMNWKPEELKAHIEFMTTFNKALKASGQLVGAEGLAMPSDARIVRATSGAAPAVTDGPYPEAKEFLAGYWLLDVASPERVYEIAARISGAPGRGGAPLNFAVEVSPVGVAPQV